MGNPVEFRDDGGMLATNGIATKIDRSNVTTPTAAELTAAFGAPSLPQNVGKLYLQDDNAAGTTVKLIVSDGASWFYSASFNKAL